MQQHALLDGDHPYLTAFSIFAIIIPHIVTLLLALMTYRSSMANNRKLRGVERTLNGKGHDAAELPRAVDKGK